MPPVLDRPIREAPRTTEADVNQLHAHLTSPHGFFIDRETYLLLTKDEVLSIVGTEDGPEFDGYVVREQLRSWQNLPHQYKRGISLLSVLEFQLQRAGGKVLSPGEFPAFPEQIALQKQVLGDVLSLIPDWKKRGRIIETKGVPSDIKMDRDEERVPYVPAWKRLPPSGFAGDRIK